MGHIGTFMEQHFHHFNSREVLRAARGWQAHAQGGGKMLVSLAGAMSTARIGKLLSRLIREDLVHAVSCTGANLEEDVFNLLAGDEYEKILDWRALSAADEVALRDRGMNRVTDVCIPETIFRHVEGKLLERWQDASRRGIRKLPCEYLFDVLDDPEIMARAARNPSESWMLAAKEKGVPVYAPGWEDSTTGNVFTAQVMQGNLPDHSCVKTGTEQFEHLMRWYAENHGGGGPKGVGFFQVGGGIPGDFAICAVPALVQDLRMKNVPYWSYFAQISDAITSYGGYSGAPPTEKITWGKLDADTPRFMIQSDATIVAPLIFAFLLGD